MSRVGMLLVLSRQLTHVAAVLFTILMIMAIPASAGITPAAPQETDALETQALTTDLSGTDTRAGSHSQPEGTSFQVDGPEPDQTDGSALQLDGEFGYASGASDSLNLADKSMTIQAWVKHDGGSEEDAVIVQKGNGYGLHFLGSGEERPVQFQVSGSGFDTLNSNQGIVADRWTHITATYDGNEMQIYIDGKLDASRSEDTGIGSDSGNPLQIGTGPSASQQFYSGQIDDVRIWDRSLSKFEVQTNPYEELAGTETGLASYYTFDTETPENPSALDQAGQNNLDLFATASKTSPDAFPIAPDTYASPETGANVTITWDERTGVQDENAADSFRVYRSTSPDSNQQEVASVSSGMTTYTDTGLESGETYYYSVTSVVNGNESDYAKSAIVRPYEARGGGSLSLDGQDDYATLSNRPSQDLNLDSGELTIETWLKHDGGSDEDATIVRNGNGWRLRFAGSGEERPVYFQISGSGFDSLTSNGGIHANEWTHLAATYDGNEMKIFINGELDASRNEDSGVSGSSQPVRLGTSAGADSNFFSGQMDEVRLWSTAREATQIENNYTAELDGNEAGLNGYWRFDSPGESVARGSGQLKGTFELAEGAALVDNGTFPVPARVYARGDDGTATITWNERVSGEADQLNLYRSSGESRTDRQQIAQVSPTTDTYTDNNVSNGETYYYELTSIDSQGQESDYSIPATAVISQNPPGKAFDFAVEQDSFGTVTARPSLFLQDQTMTVEAWIRFNESADNRPGIIRRGNGWRMELLGSGSDRSAAFRYSGSGFDEISSSQGLTAGEWTHVAVTYDGNELAMYINGELDSSRSDDGGIGNGGVADIRIGADNSGNSNFYAGQLDEVRVWDTTRSPEQINNSYDKELIGNESGLVGYWRGCNVETNEQARGSAVRPMTVNLTNVGCQASGVPMEDGSGTDDGELDFGIELQPEATVSQGSSVDIEAFPNNLANQAASGTLELRVDQNSDSQFSANEVVDSKQVSFAAGEVRTEVFTYSNVQLAPGEYDYQARISSDGQSVTSFTNGTLTVTSDTTGGEPDGTVNRIAFDYYQGGGNLNLEVNGDRKFNLSSFAQSPPDGVDGATLGGASVSVTQRNSSFGERGTVEITGDIDSFSVGGQEMPIDNVEFGPEDNPDSNVTFDTLTPNQSQYGLNDTFSSDGVDMEIVPFIFSDGTDCSVQFGCGSGQINDNSFFTANNDTRPGFYPGNVNVRFNVSSAVDGASDDPSPDTFTLSESDAPTTIEQDSNATVTYTVENGGTQVTSYTLEFAEPASSNITVESVSGDVQSRDLSSTPPTLTTTGVNPGSTATISVTYQATANAVGDETISVTAQEPISGTTDTVSTELRAVDPASIPSDPTARALQITGKSDASELTQNDVTIAVTRFERGTPANGIAIGQNDVTAIITLFERN